MSNKPVYLEYENRFIGWINHQNASINTDFYRRSQEGAEHQVFRIFIQPPGPPKGILMVAHGTGNSACFPFFELFEKFLTEGYAVYSFDIDGHGLNSTSILSSQHIGSCIADAVQDLSALIDLESGISLHFLGHSLGGCLFLDYLRKAPFMPTSLILVSAPIQLSLELSVALRELSPDLIETIFRQSAYYGLSGILPSIGSFKRDQFPIRLANKAGSFQYVGVVKEIIDNLEIIGNIGEIKAPLFLVYGEKDLMAPLSHAHAIQRSVEKSMLFPVPKATHFTTLLHPDTPLKIFDWCQSFSA